MVSHTTIPAHHLLDFFCDEEGSCALTVLVRGFRFHIIADKDELNAGADATNRYHDLVRRFQSGDDKPVSSERKSNDSETDSGIDVSDGKMLDKENCLDPEEALQQWLLEPLEAEFVKLAEPHEEESVQEWYHGPTYFYNLVLKDDDHVEPIQLEEADDLTSRMQKLRPEMILPKYTTEKLNARTYQASELTVIGTSDQPPGTPYHPCRVRCKDSEQTFFLKIVDNSQPQPVKRELDILHQCMDLELNKQINIPSLEGLVTYDDATTTKSGQIRIMGFLLTDIPSPQPLTGMLDPSIPQDKRDRWAEEADRAKEVLHEHGIIWGDAKADNFVVDKDENLWIIDFGGSYTEGWVDAEIKETMEGDDMGTEKIVNALHDPVANTQSPDEDEENVGEEEAAVKAEAISSQANNANKRKREDHADNVLSDAELENSHKTAKRA